MWPMSSVLLGIILVNYVHGSGLQLDCGDPKDFAKQSLQGKVNLDDINSLSESLGPFAPKELQQLMGVFGADSGSSGSSGTEALESECLKNAFGGSSASDTTFGNIAFNCITVTMQKKVTQCIEDIEKKKIDALTGCIISSDLIGALSGAGGSGAAGGALGNILGNSAGGFGNFLNPAGAGGAAASNAAGAGASNAAGGFGGIPGFGRRKRSVSPKFAINNRKKRQLPFAELAQLQSLAGGGSGSNGVSSIASKFGPSSGGSNCIPPTEIPLRMCLLEAEQQNCKKMQELLDNPNCNLCDVMTMAFNSDDISKCACANLDFSSGTFSSTKLQKNIEGCVTDQVASGLVQDKLFGTGTGGGASGQDLGNLAKLGGVNTDQSLLPGDVTKNLDILNSFGASDSLPVGDLKLGNMLSKTGQTAENNDFMKCGPKRK